jgi:hypothetical protein
MKTNKFSKLKRTIIDSRKTSPVSNNCSKTKRREFVKNAFSITAGLALAPTGASSTSILSSWNPKEDKNQSTLILIEPSKKVPIFDEVDVVVCGGGPAGAAAAISASRNGAKTLLIEYEYCLGGMATSGSMNHMGPMHDEKKIILGGIPWEIFQRLVSMNAAKQAIPCPPTDIENYWPAFDPEAMKFVLDEMVAEAGVKVLFHCYGVGIIPTKSKRSGLIIESKSGRLAVLAKVIIDATGDGDMAVAAGASYEKGRVEDGLTQNMSLLFQVVNTDRDKVVQFISKHLEELKLTANANGEKFPNYIGHGFLGPGYGTFAIRDEQHYYNLAHAYGLDGTKVEDLSKAVVEARKQIWQGINFSKKYIPGFEKSFIAATAAMLGVRETRRIVGDYTLSIEDVMGAKKYDDVISRYACWVDIHTVVAGEKSKTYAGIGKREPGTSYDIPYRCLLPKNVDNFIVAGRCFSATHEALASARMMPSCMAMGQAAGTAAALATSQNLSPRNLNIKTLQNSLRKDGAMI